LLTVVSNHGAQSVGIEQGDVAADDDNITSEGLRKRLQGNLERSSGSGDVVLVDDVGFGGKFSNRLSDVVSLMPHHDCEMRWLQSLRGGNHVSNEWHSRQVVEHFRHGGLHARSLTRGQDHDGQRCIAHTFI
jgi:hypothetical protein